MNARRPITILLAALAAAAIAACGEKEEPSASEIAATSAQEETEDEFPIAGDWRGRLTQKGVRPFVVTAEITGPDGPNTVHYTGIDCSGKWTYEGRFEDAFSFNERIERGRGGECKGAGTVTLEIEADDRLAYEFRGGGIESEGTLERTG